MTITGQLRMATAGIALLLSLVAAGCSSSTQPQGSASITYPLESCPATSSLPAADGQAGAGAKLVPFAPSQALLCEYERGSSHSSLTKSAAIDRPKDAAKLSQQINDDVSPSGTQPDSCPADSGQSVDGFFWNRSRHIQVRMKLGGCKVADNGTQRSAFIGDSNIAQQLKVVLRG
jgi:hypothetical protein